MSDAPEHTTLWIQDLEDGSFEVCFNFSGETVFETREEALEALCCYRQDLEKPLRRQLKDEQHQNAVAQIQLSGQAKRLRSGIQKAVDMLKEGYARQPVERKLASLLPQC